MTNKANAAPSLVKNLIVIIIFTAVAAGGGLIKIPSPVGSIALDSAPGYFCAAFFSPWVGAAVGAFGHLASAATAGFPLAVLHIYIAIQQFIWCFIFGSIINKFAQNWGLILGVILATVLNGVVAPLLLTLVPVVALPLAVAKGLIPFLIVASAANTILAAAAYKVLAKLDIPGI